MAFPSVKQAAALAEASYDPSKITSHTMLARCNHPDVQAYLLSGNVLLLPGSNSIRDYLRYNLRPLNLGNKQLRMSDDGQQKGFSGTTWHQGFLSYSLVIFDWLKSINKTPKFIIGHSLGAAATQILSKSYSVPAIGFAAPKPKLVNGRVKNDDLCLLINRTDDPVRHLPPSFSHMGPVRLQKAIKPRLWPAHSMKHYVQIVQEGHAAGTLPSHWSG